MRVNITKRSLFTTVMVLTMILLAACGGTNKNSNSTVTPPVNSDAGSTENEPPSAPPEKVTLKALMHTSWLKGGMEAVLKDAAEKVGITLEIEKLPEGVDGDNLIKTRFATNDKPDLLFFYSAVNEGYGLGKPEEQFIPQDDQPWMANFDKKVWTGAFDTAGTFYAAPYGGSNMAVMLYNKKVFESLNLTIPTTMDEFWKVSDAISKAGKVPVYLSAKDAWTLQIPTHQSGAAQAGLQELTNNLYTNKATFSNFDAQRQGMTFLKDVVDKKYVNKDFLSDTYDNAQKALANGDAAMYPMATWVMTDISTKYADQTKDIGAFLIPFNGGGKDIAGVYPPNALYVVKGGSKQDAAQKFVNYFESIETQNIYFGAEGGIPAIKGVTNTLLTPAELDAQKFAEEGKAGPVGVNPTNGIPAYQYGDYPAFLQDLVAGVKTPEQVQEAEQKEVVKNAKSKDDPNFK
ncbi:hypothetical protein Back11_34630 [Paenibacillus baekrokdamisoli]|uniref:Uncharacterized protein n=1 Tax=Paenibacillus baekrokdamisoli TaxID=1712516 RepID=A0A3G9JDP2_9BACL|nr:ABC transporter substrate-binding protein [Paenibacillus baekrokdamisoli]MBB3070943.1 raffinose/stachyose/melibiose transport system substrate-binding protein [Paenibacillus baekrokdamisoli]BBH22118.1 hypothetical protein Back11_34630 [Paenibacillus baekrokdamisoli]